jgi:pyrroline-5-carboxylate reductase
MKVGIIGAGNMGGAIARGLYKANADIELVVSNPSEAKLEALRSECQQISVSTSNIDAVKGTDVVIFAVKPWLLETVMSEVAPMVEFRRQVLVSVAAGVDLDTMWGWLKSYTCERALMRAMPNTAIAVGESMTLLCGKNVTEIQMERVKGLFDLLGRTAIIQERQMAAATALCSCGIAYAMRYVRAATEGGVELGIYPGQAREYLLQTLRGAVTLLEATGANPEVEIDKVTTPGGVTIRGLNAMESHGFTTAVVEGLKASV